MTRTWRLSAALALALAGGLLSGLLLLEHHGERAGAAFVASTCGAGAESGCEVVKRSSFSEVRGVPLAAAGLFFYAALSLALALALAAGVGGRETGTALSLILAALGVAVDLFLFGVQAFVLHAFCRLCLLSYVSSVGALVLLWPAWRAIARVARAGAAPEPRLFLLGWALGSLGLAAATAGLEATLDARQIARPSASLETPADRLSPADARAEVARLRATLDDPVKLEQYFNDKAKRNFEQAPALTLDLSDAPTVGAPNAPIHAVVYSDFLCPWCRQLALWLGQVAPQFRDRLAISFRNYPLDRECNADLPRTVHQGSCALALGGVCAAEQGRFWQYHDRVFSAGLEKATAEDALRFARESGLDLPRFEQCRVSAAARQRLARDVAEGKRVGVTGTPTVLINGKKLARFADIPLILQVESERLGLPMPTPAPQR